MPLSGAGLLLLFLLPLAPRAAAPGLVDHSQPSGYRD